MEYCGLRKLRKFPRERAMTKLQNLITLAAVFSTLIVLLYTGLLATDIVEISSKLGTSSPFIFIQKTTFALVLLAYVISVFLTCFSEGAFKKVCLSINILLLLIWLISLTGGLIGISNIN